MYLPESYDIQKLEWYLYIYDARLLLEFTFVEKTRLFKISAVLHLCLMRKKYVSRVSQK